MYSSVIICLISSIITSILNHDIQSSLCGLALFASKVMDILSHAFSVFQVKHEIKMISIHHSVPQLFNIVKELNWYFAGDRCVNQSD